MPWECQCSLGTTGNEDAVAVRMTGKRVSRDVRRTATCPAEGGVGAYLHKGTPEVTPVKLPTLYQKPTVFEGSALQALPDPTIRSAKAPTK